MPGCSRRALYGRQGLGPVLEMILALVADAWLGTVLVLLAVALTHTGAHPAAMQIVESRDGGLVLFRSKPCQPPSTEQLRRQLGAALGEPYGGHDQEEDDGGAFQRRSRRRFARHVTSSRRRSGFELPQLRTELETVQQQRHHKANSSRLSVAAGSGETDSSTLWKYLADRTAAQVETLQDSSVSRRSTRGPFRHRIPQRDPESLQGEHRARGSVDDSEASKGGHHHHGNHHQRTRPTRAPQRDLLDSLYDYGFSTGALQGESSGEVFLSDAASSSSRTSRPVQQGDLAPVRGTITAYREPRENRLPWECKLEPRWKKMEEGVFPPYLQTGRCAQTACMYGMYECTPVKYVTKVLKRDPDRCVPLPLFGANATYEEVWQFVRVKVTVACQCSQKKSNFPFSMLNPDT